MKYANDTTENATSTLSTGLTAATDRRPRGGADQRRDPARRTGPRPGRSEPALGPPRRPGRTGRDVPPRAEPPSRFALRSAPGPEPRRLARTAHGPAVPRRAGLGPSR